MSNPNNFSRRILTKSQVAKLLGVSERTLSRRHSEGIGPPCIKHGRKVVYFEESIFRWLESLERDGVRT